MSPATNGRKHLRVRLGHRGRCATIRSIPPVLPVPKRLVVTFLYTPERAGPDVDSRVFLADLGSVTVDRIGVPACGLLSRVMGVASRSHTAFPPADVSLELDDALSVSSQSGPPSAPVLQVGGCPWGFVGPVGDMLGRATLFTGYDVFQGDTCVHSRGGVSRVRISQFADDEMGSWRMFEVTGQSLS